MWLEMADSVSLASRGGVLEDRSAQLNTRELGTMKDEQLSWSVHALLHAALATDVELYNVLDWAFGLGSRLRRLS
ncbi:hypothetical protein [Rhodococcus koreensis]